MAAWASKHAAAKGVPHWFYVIARQASSPEALTLAVRDHLTRGVHAYQLEHDYSPAFLERFADALTAAYDSKLRPIAETFNAEG